MNRSLANVIFGGYSISASKAQEVRPVQATTAGQLALSYIVHAPSGGYMASCLAARPQAWLLQQPLQA